jgi:hypothetical protein
MARYSSVFMARHFPRKAWPPNLPTTHLKENHVERTA